MKKNMETWQLFGFFKISKQPLFFLYVWFIGESLSFDGSNVSAKRNVMKAILWPLGNVIGYFGLLQ